MIHQLDFDPLATPLTDRDLDNLDDRPSNDRPSNDHSLPRAQALVPDWEQASWPDLNSLDPQFLNPNASVLELALSPELATEIFDLPAFDPDAIEITATEVTDIEVTEVDTADAIASEINLEDPLEASLEAVPEVLPVSQALSSPQTHYESHQTGALTYFQYYFENDSEDLGEDSLGGDSLGGDSLGGDSLGEEGLALETHLPSLRSPGIPMGFVGAGVLAFTLVSGLTIAETVKNQPLFASGNGNQNPRKSNAERSTNSAIAPQMAQPETTAMAPAPLPSGLSNGLPDPSQDQPENSPSAQVPAAPQKMQVPLPPPLAANLVPPPPAIELPQLQPIAARLDAAEQAEIQTIAPPPPPKAMNPVIVAGTDVGTDVGSEDPTSEALMSDSMTDSLDQKVRQSPGVRQNPVSAQGSKTPSALSAQTLPPELLTSLLPIAPTAPSATNGHGAIAPVESRLEPTPPLPHSPTPHSPTPHSPTSHSPTLNSSTRLALISPTQAATPQRTTDESADESAIDPQPSSESLRGIPASNAPTSDAANHPINHPVNHAANHADDQTAHLPTHGVNPPHVTPATALTTPQELRDFLTAPAKTSSQRGLTLLPLTLVAAKEVLIQQRSAPLTLQPFTVQTLNQGDYLQAWRKSAGMETVAVIGLPAFGFIDYQRQSIILPIETLQAETTQAETTQAAAIASQWQTESDRSEITQSGDASVE